MLKWGLVLLGTIWWTAASAQQTFGGYDCTEDCSGHKAGYDWAQQNGVSDSSDCSGNSQSFVEGCEAYVEDPNRGSDEDDDGNEIDD
ncbi:hypothetical protein [Mesorhizobium sp.]|uniref:hypothetical protein n=1 Tax=Mesorhizobium sp. TaxID=1871066 RepID=UPI000FE9C2F9|nr:hypothetical protein [Mesorhizobium sp.]RWM29770.1 MAG: hypothetical protein EOR75_31810 [Mesorhizobium sp.]TJV47668.1 MAG: hypothetical protein E5Y01_31665 [Mesorhizobium sp.]